MKLSQLIECVACEEVDVPTLHGQCRTCGSHAVVWLAGEFVKSKPQQDREFLQEMGVSA